MNNQNSSIFVSDGKNEIHDGIEHAPGGGKARLDSTDTVFLLLDHQSGLLQNVKDISVAELRANTTALAKLAALQQIPVITTASVPDGPNGPLMPEIHEAAPHAVYVPRKGEVNAWDNALFVKTVRETGLDRETAQKAVDSAHLECPYSKATHGNINVVTTLIDPSPRRPL